MIKISIDHQMMQSILNGLVDQVKSKIDLNMNYVKKRCKEKYGIEKIEGIEHKDGNVVVYKDQIACKLTYEVRFPISVLITAKKKTNSSPSQNNEMRTEIDDLTEELEDILEEVAPMPEELDFLEEYDDIPPGLDLDDLEPENDFIDEQLRQHHMGIHKRKM